MKLLPLPAFTDNYIWMLHDGTHAAVVDPGDATPVQHALQSLGLTLQAILVTHHHADHVGGVGVLQQQTGAAVYGPATEKITPQPIRLSEGQQVQVLGLTLQVLEVPGHTTGHIAYYCANSPQGPLLFCGDTLFSGGCGRLFEGTPAQMHASLQKLCALPDLTKVCCAHEYTLSNLKFALAVEPANEALLNYNAWCVAQRANGRPTLPSHMAQERAVNPFLRCQQPAVAQAALAHAPQTDVNDAIAVLAALRNWKNEFR